jgi:hypothetical protein
VRLLESSTGTDRHFPTIHSDRKAPDGTILHAISELDIDNSKSVLIADKPTDIEAAKRAGIPEVLYQGGSRWVRGTMHCRGCAMLSGPPIWLVSRRFDNDLLRKLCTGVGSSKSPGSQCSYRYTGALTQPDSTTSKRTCGAETPSNRRARSRETHPNLRGGCQTIGPRAGGTARAQMSMLASIVALSLDSSYQSFRTAPMLGPGCWSFWVTRIWIIPKCSRPSGVAVYHRSCAV